ncbi:hypothetical protein MCUN1_002075 [Malassezia cuniculi]|uniref:Mediator of RNA polymerase II transcription subunit 13 n=1 Tax=Malassezia cuniculi TaxID=948313 RepID=A0AAF0EUE1_9BASI|nr:hypothetical protein MCUN1_002075 [Malassezia cuniculi]
MQQPASEYAGGVQLVSRAEPHAPALARFSKLISGAIDTLERVFDSPVVATDTSKGRPPAVWLFCPPGTEPDVPDGLEVDATGTYILADACKTWGSEAIGDFADAAAHQAYMRAIETCCAALVCDAACADGPYGKSRDLPGTYHSWEFARAPPVGAEVILLPTLVRATVVGDAMPSQALEDVLGDFLDTLQVPSPREYISVRVGLALGELGLDDEIVWPLALCMSERSVPASDDEPSDIAALSVAELLRRGISTVDAGPPSHALPPPRQRDPTPDRDDVFGGIADLTEDDFLFFGAPPRVHHVVKQSPMPAPLLVAETPQRSPAMLTPVEFTSTPWTPVDALLPERRYSSLVPSQFSAIDGPTPEGSIPGKYEAHGKFFASVAPERTHRFEVHTPQSVYIVPSVHSVPSSPSCASDQEDDAPLAQRATALLHLHSVLWNWDVEKEASVSCDVPTERRKLGTRYAALRTCAAQRYPPGAPLCTLDVPARAYSPPSVLVGCQKSIVEATCAAPAFWATLGLEPVHGRKDVCANVVVLAGAIGHDVLSEWLDGVAREYTRHKLGAHRVGDILTIYGSAFINQGAPSSARAAWSTGVVYHVHTEFQGYDLLLECKPPGGVIMPVHVSHVMPSAIQSPRKLAAWSLALYDSAARGPAYMLSPHNYSQCSWLRARTTFALLWSSASRDALHHGRVLHVAYDIQGGVVRLVGMDDRVQSHFARVFAQRGIDGAIADMWQIITSQLHAYSAVDWHIVVCRLGPMPASEARAWAGCGRIPNLLHLVIACVERGAAPLSLDVSMQQQQHGQQHGQQQVQPQLQLPHGDDSIVCDSTRRICAAFPLDPLLIDGDEPLLARKSAFVLRVADDDAAVLDAYTLHVIGVQSLAGSDADASDAKACLDDVVHHYAALTSFGALRDTTDDAPFLPWHLALLYSPDSSSSSSSSSLS